jgi:lipopolysaccharide transport system ATP-binding protein
MKKPENVAPATPRPASVEPDLHPDPRQSGDVLIRVEHVSKKFCKSLKRSLWYAVCDLASELNPFSRSSSASDSASEESALAHPVVPLPECPRPCSTQASSPASMPALRKEEFWAVRDVCIEVRRGECLGLIGCNGAGKSTLLKMLCGLIKPDAGRIEIRGRVGALIELGAGFNPILTGRENIYSRGAVLGLSKREVDRRFDDIAAFSGIEDFLDMPVQNLSSGMKIRLGFAVSVFVEPDVLLIDEVLAVGDLGFIIKCLNKMADLMQRSAVILVSHAMPMVARICTSICLLDRGQIEYMGRTVPQGIERYIRKFESAGPEEQGAGTVRLAGIAVRSRPEQAFVKDQSFVFENGDSLEFRLDFRVDEKVRGPLDVFVKILDQQLREIIDCISSVTGDLFHAQSGTLRCLVRMGPVYLNRGKHSVTVGVTDPRTQSIHCRMTNSLFFFVRASVQGWATSVVPGEWTVIS